MIALAMCVWHELNLGDESPLQDLQWELLAEIKGFNREVESERRSRQILGPTKRKCIRGLTERMRLQRESKFHTARIPQNVCNGYTKERFSPYPGRPDGSISIFHRLDSSRARHTSLSDVDVAERVINELCG